jgi:hypothetical protein
LRDGQADSRSPADRDDPFVYQSPHAFGR